MKTKKGSRVELPKSPSDFISLADWLELNALISPGRSASRVALERALRCAGLFQSHLRDEEQPLEDVLLKVFREIEERSMAAGDGYPFAVESSLIRLRGRPRDYPAYIFCLVLSYFGWQIKKGAEINPWKLFEELACLAAQQYIHGDSLWFAQRDARSNSRKRHIKVFEGAVNNLCSTLGEGSGFSKKNTLNSQDDNVDIVVWRNFADKRPSKIVMFGQCAAGQDWVDKISDLQPDKFWSQWITGTQISPLIRSFYIPHRVPGGEDWEYYASYAGVLFDRCRIALCSKRNRNLVSDTRYLVWVRTVFPLLRNA